jgi:Uma2 family endonuclease
MSTAPRHPRPSGPSPEDDPFFYGWRDRIEYVNGKRVLVQVPLTREDVLHPQEGDHIVNNNPHAKDVRYLAGSFEARLTHDPTAIVLSDVGVYWPDPVLDHHSPDVTVIVGVRPGLEPSSYRVAEEGVIPQLLVEVTSLSTRDVDLTTKRREYYQAGVPFYVIVDQLPGRRGAPRRLQLIGYRRGARSYVRMKPRRRRLWLETVELWLGIERRGENEFAVCFDAEERRIPTLQELTDARAEAEQRAEVAEQRLREMEAELRRLRGEP